MVLPLIPIALAGIGGGAAGGLLSWVLGGSTKKKEQIQRTTVDIFAPTDTDLYAPQIHHTPTYQWMIESPYGSQTSKKESRMTSTPSQEVTPTISPTITPSMAQTEGTDMVKLVLIAGVALVIFGAVTTHGGEKKKK